MSGYGDLDLAPIGNCAVSALIDRNGASSGPACRASTAIQCSAPCSAAKIRAESKRGVWAVDLIDQVRHGKLRTQHANPDHNAHATPWRRVEIVDFCPRFNAAINRIYRPNAFIRIVRPLSGAPRIRVYVIAATDWGARDAEHHHRLQPHPLPRARHDAPDDHRAGLTCPESERVFRLEEEHVFFLGPTNRSTAISANVARMMRDNTSSIGATGCACWRRRWSGKPTSSAPPSR
jgi:hypothetical protein